MVTRKLNKSDRGYLKRLGTRVQKIILEDLEYPSLDAFALEHHDHVKKPTLYQICHGERDLKLSTLRGLAAALKLSPADLLSDL